MRRIYTYIIHFVILVSLTCCNGYSTQQKLEILDSSPINLNLENMECWKNDSLIKERSWEDIPLKLCVYVCSDQCTSCYLKKMFQWEDFLEMGKAGEFYIYYIFTPQEGCEETFHKFFFQAELDYPFYLDKNREFLTLNPHLPREPMFHTFLHDENNNVILVGDILHNTMVEQDFMNILENHNISKKDVGTMK